MNCSCTRSPILLDIYQQYLMNADINEFERNINRFYSVGTLERLLNHSNLSVRRGAVLALGLVGDFRSNARLASILPECDRVTSLLAENSLRLIWRRNGDSKDREALQAILRMNAEGEHWKAITYASIQLDRTPDFAEVWFQRASAWFAEGKFQFALEDLKKTIELNPFHFQAFVMLGNVYMEIGKTSLALRAFRNALDINPALKKARSIRKFRQSLN